MILFYAAFQQFGRLSAGDANLCTFIEAGRSRHFLSGAGIEI